MLSGVYAIHSFWFCNILLWYNVHYSIGIDYFDNFIKVINENYIYFHKFG